jgi:molybdopterin-containing oxidoreductase family iron-sulfur binding subunit
MSGKEINRRDFLKIMGLSGAGAALAGCDMPSYITLEEGKEKVIPYVIPEEYNVPGVGVWYASTCRQCAAGCGIHGRVREGRVLKVEGNPESPINWSPAGDKSGKLCQMGHSGLQAHYNPDRLTKPMLRKNGALAEASWDEAMAAIKQHMDAKPGNRLAWFTGMVSGHQAELVQAHLEAAGSTRHYVHELVSNAVRQAVNRDMLGDPLPVYKFDKARMILSFGADFLGPWQSPVYFSTQYAKFREAPRGTLVQVEPKMTLTGSNADLWVAVRPGTEGTLALGIANVLLTQHNRDAGSLPAEVRATVARYDLDTVTRITGVPGDRVTKIAQWLNDRSPSLVLSGLSAEGQEHGYDIAAAAMLLNVILGNVGKTIVSAGAFPYPQLTAKEGDTRSLFDFADAADKGELDTVFFYGTNPVFTAPGSLGLKDRLQKIPFKVAFTNFHDETAMQADLVLPIYSLYEEWGTHVPAYQGDYAMISMQQPLMEPLYDTTRGFGDVMLDLLKMQGVTKYDGGSDGYYGYVRKQIAALPADLKGGANEETFWQQTLQKGLVEVKRKPAGTLSAKAIAVNLPDYSADAEFPYHLIPSPRLGMWDGRHANIPWLQEAPDQISKVVWDSWAEMHPKTAEKLGVKEGDYIRISSAQGAVETRVYLFKGIHVDAIAVPLGQGHEEYGRFAKDRGVNPMKIVSPVRESKTGELATFATRVKVAKVRSGQLIKMGGSEAQAGRKLVATITADVFRRTEGGGKNVV